MSISKDNTPELQRDDFTEYIYDVTCFGDPINPESAEDVASGISRAMELEARPVFLEGVSARLSQLGVACTADDIELILAEVKSFESDTVQTDDITMLWMKYCG